MTPAMMIAPSRVPPATAGRAGFRRAVLLAGVAALLLPAPLRADEADEKKGEGGAVVLAPISIDAKADVITGGVQVEAEDLDRRQPQDIKDVFRQEPGVTVSSPTPIGQKVYVNGIEDTKLTVDVDGARQVTKTFHHIGTAIIDPGMLKSVKVETGVAPADAGPEALGGTISYETKDGRDFVAPGETFGGFAKLTFNTNTEGFSEDLALATRVGNVDLLAYGANAGGHNYSDGNGNTVAGTAPEISNAMVKVGVTGSSGYRVKLVASYLEDKGVRPSRPNFGGSMNPVDTPQWTDYSRRSATLSFGDETPTDLWDPKVSVSYTDVSLFNEITNTPIGEGVYADIVTVNGKASNTFTTGLGKITAGVDFYHDMGEGGREGDHGHSERVLNLGAFAQARLSLTEAARVSFGGRVDHNRLKGNEGTRLVNTGFSGNVNGEYDFLPWLTGYAGAGTAWGGIPMTEIAIQNYWSRFGILWNYAGLAPSRSFNYKAGAVVEFGGFTFDGNVFYTKIDDSHDVSNNMRAANFDLESQGVNASARYRHGNSFVRGTYTLARVRVNDMIPTSTVAYQGILIGQLVSGEVGHAIPEYGLRGGVSAEWAPENDDTEKTFGQALESYVVANVYLEWMPEWVDGLSLRVDVRNLFDAAYADRANVGYDSGRYLAYNDPGRTFLLSAKYEF